MKLLHGIRSFFKVAWVILVLAFDKEFRKEVAYYQDAEDWWAENAGGKFNA